MVMIERHASLENLQISLAERPDLVYVYSVENIDTCQVKSQTILY